MAPQRTLQRASGTNGTNGKEVDAIQMVYRQFLRFVQPFEGPIPQTVLVVCTEYMYTSSDPNIVRVHDHTLGEPFTGLPSRSESLCCDKKTEARIRYMTGISEEGVVILKVKGRNKDDTIKANQQQIIDAIYGHFWPARTAFAHSQWSFKGVKKVVDSKIEELDLYLWLKIR